MRFIKTLFVSYGLASSNKYQYFKTNHVFLQMSTNLPNPNREKSTSDKI